MVAPTGVHEESPNEPANPETARAGLGEAGPPEEETAEAGAGLDPESMATGQQGAAPAEAGLAEAVPTEAELTEAEAELAETELAEAEAEAELAETELAETELAETRESRDVSPLAVAAIIVIVIALVGVAAGVLAVATHGFHKKTVVTYRPAAVFKLRPGDCINSAPNGLTVTVLSCGTPHDAEVFATFALPKSSWPGNTAVEQAAGTACASRLGGYLNPDLASAGLAQEFVYPNQTAWQAGERTVVCEVSSSTGKLTGSVRKAS
jgi:Septum formation